MSGQWQGSTRRSRLPKNWRTEIRPRILRRDGYRCTVDEGGMRCPSKATDVDHIIPNDDHSDDNLRSICQWHHRRKSASEGGTAKQAAMGRRPGRRRPREPHPGLITPT